jgi:hypothetical protein
MQHSAAGPGGWRLGCSVVAAEQHSLSDRFVLNTRVSQVRPQDD